MIQKVEMFSIVCDNCKEVYCDNYNTGFSCWSDSDLAWECADDSGWASDYNGKHYCPKCFKIDENDNMILTNVSPDKKQ